ncbi:MAG: universal stress protein [Elusimicrobiota bacterium]
MFKKILFPTDFSLYANKVLECIPDFKAAGLEEAILIHLINPFKAARWSSIDQSIIEKVKLEAKMKMEELTAKISAKYGLRAKYLIVTGNISEEITRTAKQENVSLIIMGGHGHSFTKDLMLGSTTEHVLRYTKIPLLIEKLQILEDKGGYDFTCKATFAKILLPTDFSACSQTAIQMVEEFKKFGAKEVVIAHIQDTRKLFPHLKHKIGEFNRIDTERLENISQQLQLAGYKTKTVLKEGIPFMEINKIAENEDVSMIVIGSYGRSAVKEALVGTVSEAVARHNVRPVMLVPGNWKPDEAKKETNKVTCPQPAAS